MPSSFWPVKNLSVTRLRLDTKNPRLGRETATQAPREIIQYLFTHDKALDVAKSIAIRGYFQSEPLLAVKEKDGYIVVEGNRRLAALKALQEPGLLEGSMLRAVERLSRRITNLDAIAKAPTIIAPSRRATDRQIAGRHIGTAVRAWEAENRASFILDKIEEGYNNEDLHDILGFTPSDIQEARLARAIADMARSLELPEEVKAKLDNPRAKVFSTIKRVIESSVGQEFLKVQTDSNHGIKIITTQKEFVRGFTKLVTDIALGKQSSRTLNNTDNIRDYFKSWATKERPVKKRGSAVPSDITKGKTVASKQQTAKPTLSPVKSKTICKTVLPRNFMVRYGNDRLVEIRDELVKIKYDDFPNAGAILLRVFFELAVRHYFDRIDKTEEIKKRLSKKQALQHGELKLSQYTPDLIEIAKKELSKAEANTIKKAITYNDSAPFTISDLHSFVHNASDFPGSRDIMQFWKRAEPLFRLMLEDEPRVV